MKFGKEFASQMVPEWHEAYMDYNFLKTLLKEIHGFKQRSKSSSASIPDSLKRNHTLYRAFSGLTHFRRHSHHQPPSSDVENQVISVNNVVRDGVEGSETTFLMTGEEGGEYELVFFRRLDDEFNKVLAFYKSKVDKVMNEAEVLNKQMEAFIAFRVKVDHPNGWVNSFQETRTLASDVRAARAVLLAATPSAGRRSRRDPMDMTDEEGSSKYSKYAQSDYSNSSDEIKDGERIINPEIQESLSKNENEIQGKKPAHLEILRKVKFNSTQVTPRSTIKGFLNLPNQTDLKFTKDNLKKAERQLMKAFVEFHHKLRLLKSFSFLNILAFSKIMKKYDKITSRSASKSYMKMVDNSYLCSSDEVSKLMERVEVTFIKHFSNSNRSKGMNILRPKKTRERHLITFSTGFLVGCTVALILALILVIRARKLLDGEGGVVYMETMFPLYSLFGYLVLHLLLYAGNIFFWRRYRVNSSFIFGLKPGTELQYREVLLLSFCLSVLALASILANLDLEMDPVTLDYQAITELLPLVLLLLLLVIMLCPFNIIYRSSRYFFIVSLFHSVFAPLYKVTLPDFFVADQLTSQVEALRSIEFYICYYGWGDYKRRRNNCRENEVFITFSFILAGIPFWFRFLQCLRRLYDEKDVIQGINGIKYFLTIVAVCTRTAYTLNGGVTWRIIAVTTSIIPTLMLAYWDIVYDWGLLQRKSKNRWLRDKLLVPYKSVYFVAIVSDVLLRAAWMQTVMNFRIFSLHQQAMTAVMACLEIIRRGVWNFFRLENEHLNNVGKFRAFKTVPLPFNYDEDEDKEE